jgi:hypothetical protein
MNAYDTLFTFVTLLFVVLTVWAVFRKEND